MNWDGLVGRLFVPGGLLELMNGGEPLGGGQWIFMREQYQGIGQSRRRKCHDYDTPAALPESHTYRLGEGVAVEDPDLTVNTLSFRRACF